MPDDCADNPTAADIAALWSGMFEGRIVSGDRVAQMTMAHSETGASRSYGWGFWLDPARGLVELHGYDVDTAEDGRRALALLEGGAAPDVVLLDVMMPGLDGLDTLDRIRQLDPRLPVVMLSVVGKAHTIVEAMQRGAADYLNKPFQEEELEAVLQSALDRRALVQERDRLASEVVPHGDAAVWASDSMRAVRALLEQVADTDVTMLIQGESGVGKEIVARTAHELSARRARPFVKVNCAALPADLLESELFGYEKGAFTGANGRKAGKFELANGGTILLDEVSEMEIGLQAKLLRVLQEYEVDRVGGSRPVPVDVRVMATTNRRLVELVERGQFREDLYYRLSVIPLTLPPLRARAIWCAPRRRRRRCKSLASTASRSTSPTCPAK